MPEPGPRPSEAILAAKRKKAAELLAKGYTHRVVAQSVGLSKSAVGRVASEMAQEHHPSEPDQPA